MENPQQLLLGLQSHETFSEMQERGRYNKSHKISVMSLNHMDPYYKYCYNRQYNVEKDYKLLYNNYILKV